MSSINCNGKLLSLSKPVVMGILNITNDSFYKGDNTLGIVGIAAKAEQMLADGASIIDIGGQSTRPGSRRVGANEEMDNVLPVIENLVKTFSEIIVSIDTYHHEVAMAAVQAGAAIVNDISSGTMDDQMIPTVASLQVPYIAMHIKGTPETMQKNPQYDDVSKEVLTFMLKKINQCQLAGIKDIIVDPGFGFGKTIDHNFHLLKHLELLKITEKPMLVGLSRKSTIYTTLGTTAKHALNGTTILNTIALMKGATILRVHDVKEAMECVNLYEKLQA